MTNKEAIKIMQEELMHTQSHLKCEGKAPEYYQELGDYCKALERGIEALQRQETSDSDLNSDLISREWLLERARYTNALECNMYVVPVSVIDNAPTVKFSLLPADESKDEVYMRGYEKGLAMGLLKARPQGEWKKDNIGIYCPVCKCHIDVKSPFCPLCGADMRGGTE